MMLWRGKRIGESIREGGEKQRGRESFMIARRDEMPIGSVSRRTPKVENVPGVFSFRSA